MTANRTGLIVNVSSPGGLRYLFNVCYGIGKAAVDRMSADTAVELRKHGVACVSLWPGPVATEYVKDKGLGEYVRLENRREILWFSMSITFEI